MKFFKVTGRLFFLLFCLVICSCVDNNYREQTEAENSEKKVHSDKPSYQNVRLNASRIEASREPYCLNSENATIQDMCFEFSANIPALKKNMLPISQTKTDTFPYAVFKMYVYFNDEPIVVDSSLAQNSWQHLYNYKLNSNNSISYETDEMNLEYGQPLRFSFPLYLLGKYKSGEKGTLKIKIFQNYFVSREHRVERKVGDHRENYYKKDTLFRETYHSEYIVALTVPDIYRTVVYCDSIILQNDDKWSPAGSDNTIWKSSYPDIYFAVSDVFRQQQGRSVVEHSTSKFTLGDSLFLYHYRKNERFYIDVFDYDNLSSDDFLGEWSSELTNFKPNKKYNLSFGHISRSYFHLKPLGKYNP